MAVSRIYDFIIEQGVSGGFVIELFEDEAETIQRDITGYGARMKMKKTYTASTSVMNKSTATTGLLIPTPANGKIYFSWTAAEAAAIAAGRYVYDIEIFRTVSGTEEVERVLRSSKEGIEVLPEVTK